MIAAIALKVWPDFLSLLALCCLDSVSQRSTITGMVSRAKTVATKQVIEVIGLKDFFRDPRSGVRLITL